MTGFIDPLESATPEPDQEATPSAEPDADVLASVRDLVLRAHSELVPELVHGESLVDLLASIEPARQAYADLMDRLGKDAPVTAAVPAGGTAPAPVDLERLPTAEKLRRGLEQRARRSLRSS